MSSQNFQLFTFIEVTLGESHKLAKRDSVTALGNYNPNSNQLADLAPVYRQSFS